MAFTYSGIPKINATIIIVVAALLLPINNPKLKIVIQFCSNYTLGIYCCHRLVAIILNSALESTRFVVSFPLLYCALIYLVSYFLSFAIDKYKVLLCSS